MASEVVDQAAGLRRLMAKDAVRTIGLVSPVASPLNVRLAAGLTQALAALGKRLLVIDESPDTTGLARALGLPLGEDIGRAVQAGRSLATVVQETPAGIRLVRAHRLAASVGHLSPDGAVAFVTGFQAAAGQPEVMLIQSRSSPQADALACASAAQEVLVVFPAQADAMTSAYALMKMMGRLHDRRRFSVVFSEATDEAAARRFFDRMVSAADRYLDAELLYGGCFDRAVARSGPQLAQRYLSLARQLLALPCPPDETASERAFLHRLVETCRAACHVAEGA